MSWMSLSFVPYLPLLAVFPGNSQNTAHWVLPLHSTPSLGHLSETQFYLSLSKMAFEHTCLHSPDSPRAILRIYSSLNAVNSSAAASYKVWWEWDIATSIGPQKLSKTWFSIVKCSLNTATLGAAYRVLLRWYLVPAHIASLNPSYSDRCVVANEVMLFISGGPAHV